MAEKDNKSKLTYHVWDKDNNEYDIPDEVVQQRGMDNFAKDFEGGYITMFDDKKQKVDVPIEDVGEYRKQGYIWYDTSGNATPINEVGKKPQEQHPSDKPQATSSPSSGNEDGGLISNILHIKKKNPQTGQMEDESFGNAMKDLGEEFKRVPSRMISAVTGFLGVDGTNQPQAVAPQQQPQDNNVQGQQTAQENNLQVQQSNQENAFQAQQQEQAPATPSVVNDNTLMDAKFANYLEDWKKRPDKQGTYFENFVADLEAEGVNPDEAIQVTKNALSRYANRSALDVTKKVVSALPDDTVQDAEKSIEAQWYSHGVQDKLKQEATAMGVSYDDYVAQYLKPAMVQSLVQKYGQNYRDIAEGIATRLYSHDEHVQDRLMNQDINEALSDVIGKYTSTSVAKAIQDAEAASNEQMAKYNEQSKYVDSASPFAIGAISEANKTRDPQKILGDLQKKFGKLYQNPQFLNDMSNAAFKVMQRYGVNGGLSGDPKQFKPMINAAIKNELDQLEVKGMIPKGSENYILKTGIENTIIGKVSRKIMQTDYQNWLEDIANQQYQPGFWERVGSGALTFAGDAWSYWLPGAAGGKLTKNMLAKAEGRLASDLMAKGMEAKMAERAAKVLIGKSKGMVLKTGAAHGAVTFGGQSAISKPIDEIYRTGQFDENGKVYNPSVGKILANTLGEVTKQSAVGAIMQGGTIANIVGKGRGLATNILADIGGKAVDSSIMTGQQMLERMAQDPSFKPTGKDAAESFLESMANLTSIGLPGMVGKYARFKDAKEFNRKYDFNDQDIAELKRFGYDDLRDAFEKLGINGYRVEDLNGQPKDGDEILPAELGSSSGVQLLGQLTDKYMSLMNDKSVPETLKAKMMAVVEDKRPSSFSPVIDSIIVQPMDNDGKVYLETLNKDGGIIERKEFSSLDEAQKAEKKLDFEKSLNITSEYEKAYHTDALQDRLNDVYQQAKEKYADGERLNDEDKAAIYLHQNAGAIGDIMQKLQSGMELTEQEQQMVNSYRHFYDSAFENSPIMKEYVRTFEDSQGVEHGTLRKALEGDGKSRTADQQKLVEEYQKQLYNDIVLKREMNDAKEQMNQNMIEGQRELPGATQESGASAQNAEATEATAEKPVDASVSSSVPPIESPTPPVEGETPTNSDGSPSVQSRSTLGTPSVENGGNPSATNTASNESKSDAYVMGQNAYQNGDAEVLKAIDHNDDVSKARLKRAFAGNEGMMNAAVKAYEDGKDMEQFVAQRAGYMTPAQQDAVRKYVEAQDAKKGVYDALQHADDGYGDALKEQLWPYQTEDGNIVPATLTTGQQVFLKKANEYGGGFVVVPGEGGNPTIKQVYSADIKEVGTPIPFDDYIDQRVTEQTNARQQQFFSQFDGSSLKPSDTVEVAMEAGDEPMQMTFAGYSDDGKIVLSDGKDNIALTKGEFNSWRQNVLESTIGAELDAEDAQRANEDAARAEATKQERYKKSIFGFAAGQPDYADPQTDPKVAAEYLQETVGEDRKALFGNIAAEKKALQTRINQLKEHIANNEEWLSVNADLDPKNAESRTLANKQMQGQIVDLQARFDNWNKIRSSVMTPEEATAIKEDRTKKIADAGVNEADIIPIEGREVAVLTDEELKKHYPTMDEASDYITSERQRIYKIQSDEVQREINGVDDVLNRYVNGEIDLEPEQIKELNTTKAQLQARQQNLTESAKDLKAQADNLNALYRKENMAERAKAMENMTPAEQRAIKVENAIKKGILSQLNEIYEDVRGAIDFNETEPDTLEEYVANSIGRFSLNYEGKEKNGTFSNGIQQETGLGRKDFSKLQILAKEGKGKTVPEFVHSLYNNMPEHLRQMGYTDQDIRDAFLNLIGSEESYSDIKNYTLNNKVYEAEQKMRLLEEQEEAMRDSEEIENAGRETPTFAERLQNAIAETETEPTEAQKKAGNYKKGHLSFGGYDFTVETPKGATRSGKDEQGKPWSVTMHDTYGYIKGKIGVDGDHIDMFINDDADLDHFYGNVVVIDQVNPKTGEFDEHKVMYGYPDDAAAVVAYLKNYSPGWKGLGKVTSVPKATFDKWLQSSDRKTKPFREYAMVQKGLKLKVNYNPKTKEWIGMPDEVITDDKPNRFGIIDGFTKNPRINAYYDTKSGSTWLQVETIDNQAETPERINAVLENEGYKVSSNGESSGFVKFDNYTDAEKFANHVDNVEQYVHSPKDNQGNPINEDGSLKLEPIKSVNDLTDDDFLRPTRNVELPAIPKNVDEAIGAKGKPVIIKKNIFERNSGRHGDLTPEQSREVIKAALYTPDLYGQNQKAKRPYNWVLINTKDEKGMNRTILLEVNPTKDNVEVVHWYYVNDKNLGLIKKQAIREGDQVLILPSDNSEEVGGLSNLTNGLSDGKDTNNSDNLQEKSKENAENQQNTIAEVTPYADALKEAVESGDKKAIAKAQQDLTDAMVNNNLGIGYLYSQLAHYGLTKRNDESYKLSRAVMKPLKNAIHTIEDALDSAIQKAGLEGVHVSFNEAGEGWIYADKDSVWHNRLENLDNDYRWLISSDGVTHTSTPQIAIDNAKKVASVIKSQIEEGERYNEEVDSEISEDDNLPFGAQMSMDELPFDRDVKEVKPKDMTEPQKVAFEAVSTMLKKAGIPVKVISNEDMEKVAEEHDNLVLSSLLNSPVFRFQIKTPEQKEAAKAAYDWAKENRPDKYAQYAIVNMDNPNQMPEYFEKKSLAEQWRKYYTNQWKIGNYKGFDLNKPFEEQIKNVVGKVPDEFNPYLEDKKVANKLAELKKQKGELVEQRDELYAKLNDYNFKRNKTFFNAIMDYRSEHPGEEVPDSFIKEATDKSIGRYDPRPYLNEQIEGVEAKIKANNKEVAKLMFADGGNISFMRTYHGSGADFDEFDFDHMGEGEGSQVFGWGGYVTSSKKIGKGYATRMDNDPSRANYRIQHSNGIRFKKRYPTLESFLKNDKQIAKKDIFTEQEKIDYYNEKIKLAEPYHNLYEVNIPDDKGTNYLDWDANVSQETKDKVFNALFGEKKKDYISILKENGFTDKQVERAVSSLDEGQYKSAFDRAKTGEDLYKAVSTKIVKSNTESHNDKAASKFLSSLGFTGIKYKAGRNFGGAEDGDTNYVILNPSDMQIVDHTKFAKGKGTVYGYTDGNEIVLNQDHLNPNTPIHEYQHIWRTAAKAKNPELIAYGDNLIKQTEWFKNLQNDPNYSHLSEDKLCDEAFARLTGDEGEAILEQMANDAIKENPLDTAKELSIINRLKKWLKQFWYWTLETFTKWKPEDIKKMTLADIRNLVLRDLAQGVDPRAVLKEHEEGTKLTKKEKDDATERIDKRVAELNRLEKGQSLKSEHGNLAESQENGYLPSKKNLDGAQSVVPSRAKIDKKFPPKSFYLENLANFITSMGRNADITADNFTKKLFEGMGMTPHGKDTQVSEYFKYQTDDAGKTTIRLSDHSGNALSIIKKGGRADKGYSIVVRLDSSPKTKFKANKYSNVAEYVYENPDFNGLKDIARSVFNLIDTGEYLDLAGANEVHVSPRDSHVTKRFMFAGEKGAVEADNAEKVEALKQKQLEIVTTANPMLDDYHTGIRTVEDIKTFAEALKEAQEEAQKGDYDEWSSYPDETNDLLQEALASGEITIYSSKPIIAGNFVTPSRMQAEDYSGYGKVYSKTVPVENVAWINVDEGQYAKVTKKSLHEIMEANEQGNRLNNLKVAKRMERGKKDAKTIKMATGWERGADGKWRYEMPDAKIKDTIDVGGGHIEKRYEEDMLWNGGKLIDNINAPKLFEAYPQLKDVRINTDAIMDDMPSNGVYNPNTKTITIHADKLKYLNKILNHEIQHAIQDMEGFASGGTPKNVRERIEKLMGDLEKDANLSKESLDEYKRINTHLVQLQCAKQWERNPKAFLKSSAKYTAPGYTPGTPKKEQIEIGQKLAEKWKLDANQFVMSRYYYRDAEDYGVMDNEKLLKKWSKQMSKQYADDKETADKFDELDKALHSMTNYELYHALAGEVEARNVEARMGMSDEERRNSLASETEDVDRGEQIVMNLGDASYSIVKDPETIKKLDKEDTVKVYRAMQVGEDGKLYPPMAAKVKGKFVQPIELGKWEQADERPELADDKGMFTLNKGNGKSLKAAYNPYLHTSRTPLNDQFSEAQNRPNIVTVEVEVPKSELTSGYKADKAKDAVGEVEWKAGIIQGQLTGKRKVILSRWDKPVRIVPDSEVADVIVNDMFKGKNITMPTNVVTPSLRKELEKRGVPFVETDNRGRIVGGKNDGVHYSKVYGKNAQSPIVEEKLKGHPDSLIKAGTYFSGGGLVEEGLKGIIDPVVAVEYDKKISGVYRNNFGQHIVTADVRNVDPKELVKHIDGEVEYFHASPVCKNFSQAKANGTEVELDKETAKSTADFINAVKPRVVTIENVKGYRDSEAMKIITNALDKNGYKWDADVYNAADYGGYTNRERLIVRAVKNGNLPAKPKKQPRKGGWLEAVEDIIPTLAEKPNGVAQWMDARLKADGIDWQKVEKPLYVMGSAYANGKIPHAYGNEKLPTLRTKSGDVIIMPGGKVLRADGRVLARVSGMSDDYKLPATESLAHTIIGNGIPTQLTKAVIAPLLNKDDLSGRNILARLGKSIFKNHWNEGEMRKVADGVANTANQLGGASATAYTSLDEVPDAYLSDVKKGATGWYDPETHTVHVYLPNCADADEAQRTVFHEKMGHEGMEVLLGGEPGVRKFADFVYKSVGKETRGKILDFAKRYDKGWQDPDRMNVGTQEYIAHLAEEGPTTAEDFSLWTKIKHYLIKVLKKLGIRVPGLLNDKDLRYYLMKAGKALHVWDNMPKEKQEAMMAQASNTEIKDSLSDGAGKGKPRQKKGESAIQYMKRVMEWKRWKEAREDTEDPEPPMFYDIDKDAKGKKEWERLNKEWRDSHGLQGEEMPAKPERKEGESDEAFINRYKEWEKWNKAIVDKENPMPDMFAFEKQKQDEARQKYEDWLTRHELNEQNDADLDLYEGKIYPAETNPKADDLEQQAMQDLADVTSTDVSKEGAARTVKHAVIHRRKNMEEASADDAIYINDVKNSIEKMAGSGAFDKLLSDYQGKPNKAEKLAEAIPYIIEAPRRIREIAYKLNSTGVFGEGHIHITPNDVEAIQKLRPLLAEVTAKKHTELKKGKEVELFDDMKGATEVASKVALIINGNHEKEPGFVPIDGTDILNKHVLPIILRAITPDGVDYKNLSEPMKSVLDSIRDWYNYTFDWLKDNNTLKADTGFTVDYVNHLWDKEKSDKQAYAMYVENRQRTKSPNEKPRQINTFMEGLDVGLVPKTTDITKMMAYYSRSNIEAWANKTMLQEVSGLNVISRNEEGEIISSDPLLSSVAPFNLEQYKYFEIPGVGPVWVYNVSPKQVKVTNPITSKDKVLYSEASAGDRFGVVFDTYQSSPFWKFFDTTASSMKKLELGFSGFHAGALTEVYMVQNMAEFGPKKAMANFMKYIFIDTMKNHQLPCFANPQDFQEAATHLVKFGATNDYAAADVQNMFDNFRDSMMKIQEKLGIGNVVSKAGATATLPLKVASQMLSLINKGMDRALWDFLHDGLKLATYNMRAERTKARAKAKGWTDEQLSKALDEDGQFVNDMFGGQHWDVLGASHRTLRYAGRVLLSPDWNASTSRHFLALTGYGSVWNEATFENFKQYYKHVWNATRGKETLSPEDWGRLGRQISALLCYGLGFMVFYEVIANGINAAFRALDEEKERKKAEEIRKTNPNYHSPYELAYGDEGMKWYDYLMRGNSLGQQSKIFMGRYADGTEMYIRHGKQFREVPEYLFNHKGELEFPGPMVQRMIGKANPMVRMTLDDINYLSDFQASHADQEIQRKYGKTIGLLYKDALYWAPFLIPSQENKEFKAVDFFFPSSKGFSPWKAQSYFKDFILSGDMEGVVMTYQSCERNGIDPEAQIKAAIGSVKALESAEMKDGVTSLQMASERFDEAKSITEKKKMRQKMKKFLSQSEYKGFTQKEALDMVQSYLNGEDDLKEMEKADNKYLMKAKSEDVTEDWRIQAVWNGTMETYQEYQRLKDVDKAKAKAFKNSKTNKRLFAARKAISAAKRKMNKAKKQMDGQNDAAKMVEIRKTRKELLETLNGME